MSFGPESHHNPRELRALAHSAISRARATLSSDDLKKAQLAVDSAGNSRKTSASQFDRHLDGILALIHGESSPDLDLEQTVLILDIAQKAEKVLNNRRINHADFSEPQNKNDTMTHYTYSSGSDTNEQSSSLTVRTDISDQMTIEYDASRNIVSLNYQETIFGSFLETTIARDQNGNMVISNHYTNDPGALTGLLSSAMHSLDYADQELTRREQ